MLPKSGKGTCKYNVILLEEFTYYIILIEGGVGGVRAMIVSILNRAKLDYIICARSHNLEV